MSDGFPKELSPQAAAVLAHLKTGAELDPLTAHMTMGIKSLTSRVAELRQAKHVIKGEWRNDHLNRRTMTYWVGK